MATKKRLLAYPIIDELEYRQNISSNQLNEMLKSIEQSVLRAIIRSTELSNKIDALNLGITNSYNALFGHEKSYEKYPNYATTTFATAFNREISGGRQSQNAGIVTLDWDNYNKQSKIPIKDGVLSPNVRILVDDIVRPEGDDVYNILDSDPTTFWIEQADPGEHTIEIQLPPSLSKRFNYLSLVPFPVFGIEITKIEYADVQSVWQVIFDSDKKSETYKPYRFYNATGPMDFHLTPKEYNNTIKITFNLRDGLSAMGFSTVDISLIDYHNTATTIMMPFENLPDPGVSTLITPDNLSLDFYIDGASTTNYNKFFEKNGGGIYLTNDDGTTLGNIAPIHKTQSQTWPSIDISNGLWLKVVMNEVDMTAPVFRGCKLEYQTS
jgi:hypothetical protein